MQKTNQNLTIFLGDVQTYLSEMAREYDPSAWLLDHSNYKKFLIEDFTSATTVYTALGDLPDDLSIVYSLLSKADQIYYCPPDRWSDGRTIDIPFPGESIQGLTEILLWFLPTNVRVHNLKCSLKDPNPLVDERKTPSKQIWIAGCSISHGLGVEPHERYGQLLANELDLKCSFLTRPGASIDWAADQILRSDIRKNDLVVFGVTNPERFTYFHEDRLLNGVTRYSYEIFPEYKSIIHPKNLFSHQTLYTQLYAIQKVINFCHQLKVKLILVGLGLGGYGLLGFLKTQKNYVHVPYPLEIKKSTMMPSYIDLGSDFSHPGPKQHQQYKELILEYLQNEI